MPTQKSGENGRGALIASLALLALLAAVSLTTRPYVPIDETRYVSVAWEMWLRGDFLVPFKNGVPYSHKPPFMFWVFQAGWALFGVNEWWPRLVSPLFSAGGLVLTWLLARRLWPGHADVGGRAALILVGTLLWSVFSTAAMFDVILAFWVLVGMHGVLSAAEGRRRGFVLIGIAIGFGVLTKGPVILLDLLPAAALAPWWRSGLPHEGTPTFYGLKPVKDRMSHEGTPTFYGLKPVKDRMNWVRWYGGLVLAVLLGAAVALAWALPAGLAGGEAYRNAIFWGQTADRMVDSFAHRRPLWWYLPLLPLMLFPWFVWPGLWRAFAQLRRAGFDRGSRFCLAWMLPVFVAFSFVSGKQPHYLVPLFPAFALLAARALSGQTFARIGVPALLAAALGVWLVLAGSGQIASVYRQVAVLPPVWPGALLILIAGALGFAGRRGVPGVATLALLGVSALVCLQLAASRSIDPLYDIRPMAGAIRQVQDSGRTVANTATYHAQYQFLGRLEKPLVEIRGAEIAPWLAAHPDDFAVVYLDDPQDMQAVSARFKQVYRGGAAVLVDSRTAAGLLARHRE